MIKKIISIGLLLSFNALNASECKPASKLTKDEILNVIKNGSHKQDCSMGAMPPMMATGKKAEDIATYLMNGMQGKAPKSFKNACAMCHGEDGKGMSGMSPDISRLGKTDNKVNPPMTKEIAKCASKSSDASRLICYDELAKSLGVDKAKEKITKGKGQWVVGETKSPIDDSVNVVLYLESEESIRNQFHQTVNPTLFLRCSENRTNAYINWDMFLGTDSTKVLLRFDKNKAKTEIWSISTDNKAVFAKRDIPFIKELIKHDKLLTQITPYGESPVMITFDTRGLKEAIKPLKKACGW